MSHSQTAIVTGASSGLGKAVTELLSKDGVTVFALARSVGDITLPESVIKVQVDIRDEKKIDEALSVIDKQTQQIDFLINCAGRGLVKNLEETTREEIVDVLGINLEGTISITQAVYKRMIPHKKGHIINVISTSGIKARIDEPVYVASKWGLRGFTESLRLAATSHTIRVTGVFPGGMKTDFWKGGEPRDTSRFMNPKDVALEILHILKTPSSLSPSEYVIERGF